MDVGSLAGIVLGIALIGTAIVTGGDLVSFANPDGLLIVLGGTLGATLVRQSHRNTWRAFGVAQRAFERRRRDTAALVVRIVELAELARRESVLALDEVDIDDPFLAKSVQLAVDGTDPKVIESILSLDMIASVERHRDGQQVFASMGDAAPAFGMIGTLIGLVQMLAGMDDPSQIGPAMAVALLTTLYGAILANLVFLPISDKLADLSRAERLEKEIVIQGIDSIMAGTHPRVIEEKLASFLAPPERAAAKKAA